MHAGPLLDVPDTVTPQQLEVLLNNLLQQGDPLPYAFFLQDHELAGQLGTHLQKQQVDCFFYDFVPGLH